MNNTKLEMFANKTDVKVQVFADVTGSLWMPSETVEFPIAKEFRHKARSPFDDEWQGLYGSLLKCTNSGDYQSLDFVGEVEIVVERRFSYVHPETRRIMRESTRRKVFTITKECAETTNLFAQNQ